MAEQFRIIFCVVVGEVTVAEIVLNGAATPDAKVTVFITVSVAELAIVVEASKYAVPSNRVDELP